MKTKRKTLSKLPTSLSFEIDAIEERNKDWTVIAVKKNTKDRLDKFMANLIYKTSYDEIINDYLDDLQR